MTNDYLFPTFSAFNLSAFAPGSIREMGDAYSLSGSQTFTWSTTNSFNVDPNTIGITDVTNSNVVLGSALANDGSEALNIGTITFDPVAP